MLCHCSEPPFNFQDYEVTDVGVDETNGRFGEVTLHRCRKCGTLWLKYLIELEAFSNSGRWYRGQITPEQAKSLTPENAATILASLEWHFYGGSYFNSTGARANGGTMVDL